MQFRKRKKAKIHFSPNSSSSPHESREQNAFRVKNNSFKSQSHQIAPKRSVHHSVRSRPFNKQKRNIGESLNPELFIRKAENTDTSQEVRNSTTFNDFQITEGIKRNLRERGFVTPTPIQEKSIPHILQGKDVIGIANTGTGKTAAFLLPTIHKLLVNRGERVLIMTPTRELALQILEEYKIFGRGMPLSAVLCIGGTSMYNQEKHLQSNPQIIIGTPGRLKDLVNRRKINLKSFRTVVLDEVDRMVDIGFIHDITYLISFLPKERQSLFFSATVTDKVKTILNQFVNNPVTVSVKKQDTSANVDQNVIKVKDRNEKLAILQNLLQKDEFRKVLVFGRTKWGVEKLSKKLIQNGFKAAAIHGNKSQGQRQKALELFKQHQLQVLLATDVASRGLDIENVTHVINYDAPSTYEDYIHRIGRTGRADNKGSALTFVE